MIKKQLIALLLALLLCGAAHAEYWTDLEPHQITCSENRLACQVLQTVMMGCFDEFDPEDSLDVRVFSAALPHLTGISDDDMEHFTESFDVQSDTIEHFFAIALSNCLWADILINPEVSDPDAQNARMVLYLFLDPDSAPDAEQQISTIRESATEDVIELIAEKAGVPESFAEHLILGEDL